MTVTITRHPENTLAIGGDGHPTHPDTTLTATGVLVPDTGVWHQRAGFGYEVSNDFLLVDVHAQDDARIIEQITMSAKAGVYNRPDFR